MGKIKSHSGASKRFKITKSGKVKRRKANRGHIMTKKSTKRKRHLRKPGLLSDSDQKRVIGVIS